SEVRRTARRFLCSIARPRRAGCYRDLISRGRRRGSASFPRKEPAMCGIVGYVGKRAVQDLLLAGLTRLEYRGYDSAGISVIVGEEIESVRAVGNLDHLRDAVANGANGANGADGDGGAVA